MGKGDLGGSLPFLACRPSFPDSLESSELAIKHRFMGRSPPPPNPPVACKRGVSYCLENLALLFDNGKKITTNARKVLHSLCFWARLRCSERGDLQTAKPKPSQACELRGNSSCFEGCPQNWMGLHQHQHVSSTALPFQSSEAFFIKIAVN